MPITPGCQSSPASTYAAAGPCSATCASAANRIRVSTSRRSALTASSSAAIALARAGSSVSSSSSPASARCRRPAALIRGARRKPMRARVDRARVDSRDLHQRAQPGLARAARARAAPRARARGSRRRAARRRRRWRAPPGRGPRPRARLGRRAVPARACTRRRWRTAPGTGSPPSRGCTIGASGQHAVGAWGVVVGDHDVEAGRARRGDLLDRGDRAVDGDQQVGPACGEPLDGRGGEPVAVVDAARQVPVDIGVERAQRAHEHGRGRHPVDVVVAVDGDPRPALDVRQDAVRGLPQAAERGQRMALLGGQERARDVRGRKIPPHQHLRQHVRDAELGRQALGDGVVVRSDGESGVQQGHGGRSVRSPSDGTAVALRAISGAGELRLGGAAREPGALCTCVGAKGASDGFRDRRPRWLSRLPTQPQFAGAESGPGVRAAGDGPRRGAGGSPSRRCRAAPSPRSRARRGCSARGPSPGAGRRRSRPRTRRRRRSRRRPPRRARA